MLSQELNEKFTLHSRVVKHKMQYVLQFPTVDANKIHDIIKDTVIDSMKYKIPLRKAPKFKFILRS